MLTRSSGILLHISSLPSFGGIGDFGPAAYDFVDFLHNAKQKYWQILPLNPTDAVYGNCPYSSPSAFALNTLFISPELLVKDGLLKKDELRVLDLVLNPQRVDYLNVIEKKSALLEQAFGRFKNTTLEEGDFAAFCENNSFWLEAYAQFVVLKKRFNGTLWSDWPEDLRDRRGDILKEFAAKFPDDIKKIKFFQWIAFKQWGLLRAYCGKQKVGIIGDIPIYVNEDSADVWGNREIFKLDAKLKPIFVAGVPPDYFSKTGQRWGNPVYDWQKLKDSDYQWWSKRVAHNLQLFDVVRIDHFRGLMEYWEIPAADKTAINGHWAKGPGEDFLRVLHTCYPDLPIIAEDLGVITPDVSDAMEKFHLPGMKILQFAFNGDLKHPYLPDNFTSECIVYTGTHDNNTTKGWFCHDASQQEKQFLQVYFKKEISAENVSRDFMALAQSSQAVLSILPMQDVLDLDEKSRMNIPGTVLGNWEWRMQKENLTDALSSSLACLTDRYQRFIP